MSNISYTDIQNAALIYRIAPSSWHPYISLMRLDRPVGIYLLYLPCVWGVLIGQMISPAPFSRVLTLILLFGLGAIVMRGAGCVINDLWDRDFDRAVERTKQRPLASGTISPHAALIFLMCLCLIGLIILWQLPAVAIGLGILSLIPVILYPLAKRFTWYPQFVLGLTFNFGVLIGGASLITSLNIFHILPIALVYLAALFWTVGYDTIYAHQDIEDDQKIGVKSTAQKFGAYSYELVLACYIVMAILMAGGFYLIPIASFLSWGLWATINLWMIYRHSKWKPNDPYDCLRIFKSHVLVGVGMSIALLINIISL